MRREFKNDGSQEDWELVVSEMERDIKGAKKTSFVVKSCGKVAEYNDERDAKRHCKRLVAERKHYQLAKRTYKGSNYTDKIM